MPLFPLKGLRAWRERAVLTEVRGDFRHALGEGHWWASGVRISSLCGPPSPRPSPTMGEGDSLAHHVDERTSLARESCSDKTEVRRLRKATYAHGDAYVMRS